MSNKKAKYKKSIYSETKTLDFGGAEIPLTDDQKVDVFISKYMDIVDPIAIYKNYFESSAKGVDHILLEIKRYYKVLVLGGKWSEKKYVACVNDILEHKVQLNVITLERRGFMFDSNSLSSQKRIKGRGGKRI